MADREEDDGGVLEPSEYEIPVKEGDIFDRSADLIRSTWIYYKSHSTAFLTLFTVVTGVLALLAAIDPAILGQLGNWLLLIISSDVTHTLLLLVLIVVVMTRTAGGESDTRTDGGEPGDIVKLAWAGIVGLAVGAFAGSTYGNEWVLPGFFVGLTFVLFLISRND